MILQPLPESQASENVRDYYDQLKKALDVQKLPIFFQYFGPFPEFLGYISSQLVRNLTNEKFSHLTDDLFKEIQKTITVTIHKSSLITKWLEDYKHLPEFYYFKKELEKIFTVNIKMSLIFLSIREAVKGWAIATKKLPENINKDTYQKESAYNKEHNKLIFEVTNDIMQSFNESTHGNEPKQNQSGIVVRPDGTLVKNLLPDYLHACKLDFDQKMHKPEYVFYRLECEKRLLNNLELIPTLIFCPINVILGLTSKYPNYPEILYLLSEHFPTYIVQRMIFSAFLMF